MARTKKFIDTLVAERTAELSRLCDELQLMKPEDAVDLLQSKLYWELSVLHPLHDVISARVVKYKKVVPASALRLNTIMNLLVSDRHHQEKDNVKEYLDAARKLALMGAYLDWEHGSHHLIPHRSFDGWGNVWVPHREEPIDDDSDPEFVTTTLVLSRMARQLIGMPCRAGTTIEYEDSRWVLILIDFAETDMLELLDQPITSELLRKLQYIGFCPAANIDLGS